MGVIQNSVNSALSGTAFLLNQSGALDEVRERTKANREGEKKLKELEMRKDIVKEQYDAEKTKLSKGLDSIKSKEARRGKEAGLNAMAKKYAEDIGNFAHEEQEIKLDTPKYRDETLAKQVKHDFKVEYAKEYFNARKEFREKNAIIHLQEAVDAKENGEAVKGRLAEIYGWEDNM